MGDSFVAAKHDGKFLFVTLNRPEKRNAFTIEMVDQLSDAICGADGIPGVRAVIVNAEGPIFSAGVDVFALAQSRAEASDQNAGRWLRRMAEGLQHALHRIEATETPVIGALHGKVLGLGLEVALSFDLRVATSSCTLGLPESRLGLVADVGGTTRLSRTVGPSRAKDLLMTAREMGADEALSWGLVNRVAPDTQLLETTMGLANQIASNAPMAVGLGKRIIDQGDGLDKHTQMALERWAQGILITTEDFGEATQAFAERRSPDFRGL